MGPTESAVDTRAVSHARIEIGKRTTTTNVRGLATVRISATRQRVTVVAGNTLKPTAVTLRR
jgi:SMC interacting uncharacterized protein involved in chromosome segregation